MHCPPWVDAYIEFRKQALGHGTEKLIPLFSSTHSQWTAQIESLALHIHICLVSVIWAWVSIDFTFAKFNSCRWRESPATDYWYWSAGVRWRMGRYGTDCANEVAYLLPELLARSSRDALARQAQGIRS